MIQLKIDLHLHTSEDPKDRIRHSARELIEKAKAFGFDALAITNHNARLYTEELRLYAEERGILLIPGVEATIEGKHVVLLNMEYEAGEINTFEDLRKRKREEGLILAPHPFFPSKKALHSKLLEHLDLFDAIELCHFYTRQIDFNKRAISLSREYGLPLVGTSDTHKLWQFNTTYSLVTAEEKKIGSVLEAIKKGKVEVVSTPLSLIKISVRGVKSVISVLSDTLLGERNRVRSFPEKP
ncbi:MAG: PHP domain-containing protein [Candidatus Tectomicrobia bacterium]|nr:PHP domain-containing protein [Candidatus Tectomicrobia bacterium]